MSNWAPLRQLRSLTLPAYNSRHMATLRFTQIRPIGQIPFDRKTLYEILLTIC
ncbi:MAG: hypothetical protein ACFFDI_30625 [Promethearchaeota archaeon]